MSSINITLSCPMCGSTHSVLMNEEDLEKFEKGEELLIAMPIESYTSIEREQMISRMCPKCIIETFELAQKEREEEEDIDFLMRDSLESTGQWW